MTLNRLCLGLAALLGILNLANGVYMLVAPSDWYFAVPGVTGTGPFNQHFIRDIGLIHALIGAGLLAGVIRPVARPYLWTAAALWLASHALFHFWEVAVGICAPSALARDFPGVTLPAIIAVLLVGWSMAGGRGRSDQRVASTQAGAA
jgi:hypothetical protein